MEYTLLQKQFVFTRLLAELIGHAYVEGFTVVFGEVLRTPEMAQIYAKRGIGIANSLHCSSLAADLRLYQEGRYFEDSESYRWLGEYWESLSKVGQFECCWGGRFKDAKGRPKPDGCHFSITHYGRK